MDEGLVAGEEPVPAGEEVALEPAFAEVLAQDLHHAPVGGKVDVGGQGRLGPGLLRDLIDRLQTV